MIKVRDQRMQEDKPAGFILFVIPGNGTPGIRSNPVILTLLNGSNT